MVKGLLRVGLCCGAVAVLWVGCGDADVPRTPAGPSVVLTGVGGDADVPRTPAGPSVVLTGVGGGELRDAVGQSPDGGGLKLRVRAKPAAPVGGVEVDEAAPALVAANAEGAFAVVEFMYDFELYKVSDADRVFVERGTESQGTETTAYQVQGALESGEDYEWRVRATFGGVADAWSAYVSFATVQPLGLGAPKPAYPVGGEPVSTLRPIFNVTNGEVVGDVGTVINEIQVSLDREFSDPILAGTRARERGDTDIPIEEDLMPDSAYFWRARARNDDGGIVSDWSEIADFRTPEPTEVGPTNGPSKGDCCPPPRRSDILMAVHSATGNLFRTDVRKFTQRVAECLAVTDGDWGRRLNGNGNLGKDTVGYRVPGEIPFSIDLVLGATSSNPRPRWAEIGQRAGSWVRVDGSNCVLGNVR